MVGMLGCGCCGNRCNCNNSNQGQIFEQFNTKPQWNYDLGFLTSNDIFIDNGRLRIQKPVAINDVYAVTIYPLPRFQFQKLFNENPPFQSRSTSPCFKKLTLSIDYEMQNPEIPQPTPAFAPTSRNVFTSLSLICRETPPNFSNQNLRYVNVFSVVKTTSGQIGTNPTITIGANGGDWGYPTLLFASPSQTTQTLSGNLKMSCEWQGINSNNTNPNSWLWKFFHNNTEIFQGSALNHRCIGLGEICDFDIAVTVSFSTSDIWSAWGPKATWIDNLKLEYSEEL